MPLTMRPTGGRPVYMDEGASASTPADVRWFWSVTVYVGPKAGIIKAEGGDARRSQGAV